jgi:transposase
MLEYVPASFFVIRHVRPKLSCAACERIVQAAAPSRPIERGIAGPGLLAHVLVSKYADHLPLYRQSEIYARQDVNLERSTLADWVGGTQDLLLPPSLRDWLPEDHLAYFVSDVVDQLDLNAIESVYEEEERGQPPYHPRMMTKILLYGYCVGVFSSRRMQKKLAEDVGFRVLAAGNEPDFRTISDFRKLHLPALQGLFEQVVQIALQAGTMKLGRVVLDGSKVKANASKHKAMSYGRMQEEGQAIKRRGEAVVGAGRGRGCGRGCALRTGSERRRTAGGVGEARDATAADPRSEAGVGRAGARAGQEERRARGKGQAQGQDAT